MIVLEQQIKERKGLKCLVDLLFSMMIGEATEREIMSLIKEFAAKIREIKRKYPDCGIGDTETDELIIMEVYEQIHQA